MTDSHYAKPRGAGGPYTITNLDPGFHDYSVNGPGIEKGKKVLMCDIVRWMNHAYVEGFDAAKEAAK